MRLDWQPALKIPRYLWDQPVNCPRCGTTWLRSALEANHPRGFIFAVCSCGEVIVQPRPWSLGHECWKCGEWIGGLHDLANEWPECRNGCGPKPLPIRPPRPRTKLYRGETLEDGQYNVYF